MYADVLVSMPVLVALMGALAASLVGVGVALHRRLHLCRHIQTGRKDLSVTRAGAQDARERSRNAANRARHVQRGAETDTERLMRLQAEVAVWSRGQVSMKEK